MSHISYDLINEVLHGTYKTIAESSMANAAKEIRCVNDNNASDDDILLIAEMQKREYSSMYGVTTAIFAKSKVIDQLVMTKHCGACPIWKKERDSRI